MTLSDGRIAGINYHESVADLLSRQLKEGGR